MRKTGRIMTAAVVAVLVAGGAVSGIAGDEAAPAVPATTNAVKHQTTCPVMVGNAINKKLFADYEGQRVYFCCNACPAMFKKDPAKYIKKMEAEGVTLDKTPQAATTNDPAAGAQAGEGHKVEDHSGHHHK